ncbi:MAG: hypothetical protein IPJ81_09395 [Chitinophagaceae bacterium]|nr:hypothetical protein [Chitinophagaceae bacterium]
MKLKTFLCVIICCLAAGMVVAQNKNTTAGKTPKWTEAQASAIIKYGNQLVEFFNRNSKIVTTMESIRSTYDGNKERLSKNEDASVHYLGSKSYLDIPNRNNAIPVAPAGYPDKSVPQLFSECEVLFKKIKTDCASIEDYLTKKTFATDDFSTSDKLMEGMEEQADSVYSKMRRAINRASKLSSDAEMVFLQKSPIKHLVIPMKTDLSAFKDILNDLEASSANPNADLSAVKEKLADLKETYEKNKVTEGKDFSKKDVYYKLDVYPKFYKNLLLAISSAEKYIQNAESLENAGESEKEEWGERLNASQSNMFSYYNTAIDSYNTFIRN